MYVSVDVDGPEGVERDLGGPLAVQVERDAVAEHAEVELVPLLVEGALGGERRGNWSLVFLTFLLFFYLF